jgi:hypothetical protein
MSLADARKDMIMKCLRPLTFICLSVGPLVGCNAIVGIDPNVRYVDPSGSDSGVPIATVCQGTLRVRIGKDTDGATKDVGTPWFYGVYDYIRSLQEAGGLRGCAIEVEDAETSYIPSKMVDAYTTWKAEPTWPEVSCIFSHGTGPTKAIASLAMEDKKVLNPGSYAGIYASPDPITKQVTYPAVNVNFETADLQEQKTSVGFPYVFYPGTDYSTAARIGVQVAWQKGGKRIAAFHGQSEYNTDPLAALKNYVELLGVSRIQLGRDLIVDQVSTPDQATVTAQVKDYFQQEIDHKKANPEYVPVDWIWVANTLNSAVSIGIAANEAEAMIAQQMGSLAWKLNLVVNNWGCGETVPHLCPNDACVGRFHGLFPFRMYGDINASAMPSLMETHDAYRLKDGVDRELYKDVRYVQGYVAAWLWRMAVDRAIDDGHDTITADVLKEQLEKMHNVDLGGLTAGPLSYGPKDHRPEAQTAVYNVGPGGTLVFEDSYSISLEPTWLGW